MPRTKQCQICKHTLPIESYRIRSDTGKRRNQCRVCEGNYGNPEYKLKQGMLAGARYRAKTKGVAFDLDENSFEIPAICPILRIPLVSADVSMNDNSPTLDRKLSHLGYTKGNVLVISNLANRIKTNANSFQIAQVLAYVKSIEEEHI